MKDGGRGVDVSDKLFFINKFCMVYRLWRWYMSDRSLVFAHLNSLL